MDQIAKIIAADENGAARNSYGNLTVTERRRKVANRHGYGFTHENGNTTRSRALIRAREAFGPEAVIREQIGIHPLQVNGINESFARFAVVIVGTVAR